MIWMPHLVFLLAYCHANTAMLHSKGFQANPLFLNTLYPVILLASNYHDVLFKISLFSSAVVASQLTEDSTCDLIFNHQSCSTATTSTVPTPQAQDFSGQTSKSLLHNTPIKKKQRTLSVHKAKRLDD